MRHYLLKRSVHFMIYPFVAVTVCPAKLEVWYRTSSDSGWPFCGINSNRLYRPRPGPCLYSTPILRAPPPSTMQTGARSGGSAISKLGLAFIAATPSAEKV
jgi:hypothetical protein